MAKIPRTTTAATATTTEAATTTATSKVRTIIILEMLSSTAGEGFSRGRHQQQGEQQPTNC